MQIRGIVDKVQRSATVGNVSEVAVTLEGVATGANGEREQGLYLHFIAPANEAPRFIPGRKVTVSLALDDQEP